MQGMHCGLLESLDTDISFSLKTSEGLRTIHCGGGAGPLRSPGGLADMINESDLCLLMTMTTIFSGYGSDPRLCEPWDKERQTNINIDTVQITIK